jgi:hypothetical protein
MKLTAKQDLQLRIQLQKMTDLTNQLNQISQWHCQDVISSRKRNEFDQMVTRWHNEKFKENANV